MALLIGFATLFFFFQLNMPMTAAERQRRYRERLAQDPEKRELYLAKERKRWKDRRDEGKVKSVKEMSDREVRRVRKYWRTAKRLQKNRQQQEKPLTPPNSPPEASCSTRKSLREKNRRKMTKKVQVLTHQLREEQKRSQKYKQRWLRLTNHIYSPKKKTNDFLATATSREVRCKLVFHNVLLKHLRSKYQSMSEEEKKRSFKQLFSGQLVRKYKLKKYLVKEIGLPKKIENAMTSARRSKYRSKSHRFAIKVEKFLTRDDNSRSTAGRKETKTLAKVKKQKRLLTDSLKNLHEKFLSENVDSKMSYALFCRLRPFWVVQPRESDRQTCLCRVHENFAFAIQKLHSLKVLNCTCDTLIEDITCNTASKECMYNICDSCKDYKFVLDDLDPDKAISWKKWETKKEEREVRGNMKTVAFTVKQTVEGSLRVLAEEATIMLPRYKKHIFNIKNQYRHVSLLRRNMNSNECMIHIDFSENYAAKLANEIQSMHFGASKRQISLHTGMYYVGSGGKPVGFCSVSDSLVHSPAGIWAHLKPVLDLVQKENELSTIHFVSDGPTTQYKQKGNFGLFITTMKERGMQSATWNFCEAGHGKGAPDGIGGAVKVNDHFNLQLISYSFSFFS